MRDASESTPRAHDDVSNEGELILRALSVAIERRSDAAHRLSTPNPLSPPPSSPPLPSATRIFCVCVCHYYSIDVNIKADLCFHS